MVAIVGEIYMKALWSLFWSVCLLRRGPADLPRSWALLLLVLVLDMALSISMQGLDKPSLLRAGIGLVLIGAVLDALVLWALTLFKNVRTGFLQALTAIYGTDFMMSLLMLPLVLGGLWLPKTPWLTVMAFGQIVLTVWSLSIRGFIYYRSLSVGVFLANALSLTLFLLTVFISTQFFPELMAVSVPH
jgi:hypothetical protein